MSQVRGLFPGNRRARIVSLVVYLISAPSTLLTLASHNLLHTTS